MKEKSSIELFNNENKNVYNRILKVIKKYDRIAIFRHIRPDFDAFGAQLGLYYWLKTNFPEKEVIVLGDNHVVHTPRLYRPMDEVGASWFEKPFLAIITDVNKKSRVADPRFKKAKYKIRIDHHPEEEHWGKITLIKDKCIAVSELVAAMLIYFKKKDYQISKESAFNLYTGIIGDSGNFKYHDTSSLTFEVAAELIKSGLHVDEINQIMFEKTLDDLRLTSYLYNNYTLTPKGVAYYILNKKELEEFNITTERGKDNINIFSNIDGINIWLSITEDITEHIYRLSIRSKNIPINEVAMKYKGGGHPNASGGQIKSLAELPNLIKDLEALIK